MSLRLWEPEIPELLWEDKEVEGWCELWYWWPKGLSDCYILVRRQPGIGWILTVKTSVHQFLKMLDF